MTRSDIYPLSTFFENICIDLKMSLRKGFFVFKTSLSIIPIPLNIYGFFAPFRESDIFTLSSRR